MLFNICKTERDYRHISVSGFGKCLAQKRNVIGRTASAAGLEKHQRGFVWIVFSALYGIYKLTDNKYCGVAGVVMHIFQLSLIHIYNVRNILLLSLGMTEEHLRLRDHEKEELSHYSNATTDFEFLFPFGWGELWGVADRTNFDLSLIHI